MIVSKENERLYFNSWEYNAARIMSHIAVIVENNGGRVDYPNAAIISNRTVSSAIRDFTLKIERVKNNDKITPDRKAAYLATLEKDLAEWENIPNDPIRVTHTSYIRFVLNDTMFYYSVDRNPFFDFHYSKTPIKNGKYSRDAYLMNADKEWLHDCFLGSKCSDADRVEAANIIFNMLLNSKNSGIHRESTKRRVPNTYNSGYHYETIYQPEKFATVDF